MQVLIRIDLNLFMAIVCTIIYFSSRRMSESHLIHNRLFRSIIGCVGLLLILESLTWVFDGSMNRTGFCFNYFVTICLFILTPLPSYLWELYVKCQLFHDTKPLRMDMIVFGIPIVVCLLLTLTTPFTNLMFFFDDVHNYHRGVLYPALAAASLLPVLSSIVSVLIHRKQVTKKYARLLFSVSCAIIAAALLQIAFYGLTLIWSGITIAILFTYMNIQNDQVYLDHLTGVFNRRQMDIYLTDRIRMSKEGRNFSCILLDLDHFKEVNDKLGHVAGDEALKNASVILKSSIRKNDFLARYGGDEFIIVTDIDDSAALGTLVNRINENALAFSINKNMPYSISFSAGQAVYHPESEWTKEQFIAYVDELMYESKGASNKRITQMRETGGVLPSL